jgi:hypothetical protein
MEHCFFFWEKTVFLLGGHPWALITQAHLKEWALWLQVRPPDE